MWYFRKWPQLPGHNCSGPDRPNFTFSRNISAISIPEVNIYPNDERSTHAQIAMFSSSRHFMVRFRWIRSGFTCSWIERKAISTSSSPWMHIWPSECDGIFLLFLSLFLFLFLSLSLESTLRSATTRGILRRPPWSMCFYCCYRSPTWVNHISHKPSRYHRNTLKQQPRIKLLTIEPLPISKVALLETDLIRDHYSEKLFVQKSKTEATKNNFYYRRAVLRNSIPSATRNLKSLARFYNQLDSQ